MIARGLRDDEFFHLRLGAYVDQKIKLFITQNIERKIRLFWEFVRDDLNLLCGLCFYSIFFLYFR